jgi:hypothetical protein
MEGGSGIEHWYTPSACLYIKNGTWKGKTFGELVWSIIMGVISRKFNKSPIQLIQMLLQEPLTASANILAYRPLQDKHFRHTSTQSELWKRLWLACADRGITRKLSSNELNIDIPTGRRPPSRHPRGRPVEWTLYSGSGSHYWRKSVAYQVLVAVSNPPLGNEELTRRDTMLLVEKVLRHENPGDPKWAATYLQNASNASLLRMANDLEFARLHQLYKWIYHHP